MSKSKLNYKVYNGKALSKIFENSKIYFLSAMLISGIIIGASVIKNSSELSSMVSEIAEEFVKARDGKGIIGNFIDSLKVSISFNAATVFMGFSLIGYPLIIWLPFFRGLGLGAVTGYMYSIYKISGLGYCVLTVYPAAIVSVFSFLLACNDSCDYSKNAFSKAIRGRGQFEKDETRIYLTRQVIFAAVCILSSAIDAVFTALFTGFFEI